MTDRDLCKSERSDSAVSLRAKRSNLMLFYCNHLGDCFGTKVPRNDNFASTF